MTQVWSVESWFKPIWVKVKSETMTPLERVYNLAQAAAHLTRRRIPGTFVECGVWRGGSMMTMAMTLLLAGDRERHLVGYDTFAGMPSAGEHDRLSANDLHYDEVMAQGSAKIKEIYSAKAGREIVERNLASTGYPQNRITLVRGNVLQSIPLHAPKQIALLRLDTDFYDSTLHEMQHLYPRLVSGGVLIIDDYGHFKGAKKAVDEYLATVSDPPLLVAVDYSCRIAVKP